MLLHYDDGARRDSAGHCRAVLGSAGRVLAWQASPGTVRSGSTGCGKDWNGWAGLAGRGEAGRGAAWRGTARHGRRVAARRDWARRGKARQAWDGDMVRSTQVDHGRESRNVQAICGTRYPMSDWRIIKLRVVGRTPYISHRFDPKLMKGCLAWQGNQDRR